MDIFSLILEKKETLTDNIVLLRFQKPDGFSFLAGQFVQFMFPNSGQQTLRSYSIASAPNDPYLEFCVKLLPNGVASGVIEHIESGNKIDVRGPLGRFIVNGVPACFFIAAGVGIAPIMGMLRDQVLYKKTEREMRLLFGVRSEADLFWVDELEKLRSSSPNMFSYHVTLSQPKLSGGWTGLRGRVTEHLLHHLVEHSYYLCGSAAMVKDVRETLMKNGITANRIHFEIF